MLTGNEDLVFMLIELLSVVDLDNLRRSHLIYMLLETEIKNSNQAIEFLTQMLNSSDLTNEVKLHIESKLGREKISLKPVSKETSQDKISSKYMDSDTALFVFMKYV
jgi:uncharacterized protein (DUF111 family)